jgi:uncharacterized damage-inducible protein DinB
MNTQELRLLCEYNCWADRRTLAACAGVSSEQFAASPGLGVSRGSLRATLLHIVDSLWQWRLTFNGHYSAHLSDEEYRATELKEADFPTLEAIQERWQAEQQAMQVHLGGLSDEQLNGTLRYTTEEGLVRERILWHCLFDVFNHATHHRSEAAALLAGYGQSPGDMEFTLFLNERERPR